MIGLDVYMYKFTPVCTCTCAYSLLRLSILEAVCVLNSQIKDEQGNFKTENFSELRHVAFNITEQNGNVDGEKPATTAPVK